MNRPYHEGNGIDAVIQVHNHQFDVPRAVVSRVVAGSGR